MVIVWLANVGVEASLLIVAVVINDKIPRAESQFGFVSMSAAYSLATTITTTI